MRNQKCYPVAYHLLSPLFVWIWLVAFWLTGSTSYCRADHASAESDAHSAVWGQRRMISSGRFEITVLRRQFGTDVKSVSTNTMYTIEISGSNTRFDVNADALVATEPLPTEIASPVDFANSVADLRSSDKIKIGRRRQLYVESMTQNYLYMDKGQLQVNIPSEMAKRAVQFFDVRLLGLESAPSPSVVQAGRVRLVGSGGEVVGDRNLMRLECEATDGTKTTILIDPQSAAVMRVEGVSPDGRVRVVTDIENYKDLKSGIVFPKEVTTRNYNSGNAIFEVVMLVTKATLNAPVDESRFDPEHFAMRKNTLVIDEGAQRPLALWNGTAFVWKPDMRQIDQATMDLIRGPGTQPAR